MYFASNGQNTAAGRNEFSGGRGQVEGIKGGRTTPDETLKRISELSERLKEGGLQRAEYLRIRSETLDMLVGVARKMRPADVSAYVMLSSPNEAEQDPENWRGAWNAVRELSSLMRDTGRKLGYYAETC